MSTKQLVPVKETFQPLPWQEAPLYDHSPTLLLAGAAGGGKSKLWGEKLHMFCLLYPGATCVMSRKIKEDCQLSIVPFYDMIIGNDPRVKKVARKTVYEYLNGSRVYWTGIKDKRARQALKSIGQRGKIDLWIMEEGTEYEEDDFEAVSARMRGTAADWTQIIIPTNPGGPLHWINTRLIIGREAKVYTSTWRENIYNPKSYAARMAALTGARGERMREGRWTMGTGRCLHAWVGTDVQEPEFGRTVVDDLDFEPRSGEVIWFVDDGYSGEPDPATGYFKNKSNPRVILWAQKKSNDQFIVFDEHFQVKRLAFDHLAEALRYGDEKGYPKPDYVVYDGAAASLYAELRRLQLRPYGIRAPIKEGLTILNSYLAPDHNGIRRLLVHERCRLTQLEAASYSLGPDGNPIDAYNHAMDSMRYGMWFNEFGAPPSVDIYAEGVDMEAIEALIERAMSNVDKVMEGIDHIIGGS